jgi:hypothetical protein
VIEAENECQALVEEALGFGLLRRRWMNAEAGHERGLTLGTMVCVWGEGGNR